MPEAISSAELTKRVQRLLLQYIISFKALKYYESLKFIQERYAEKEFKVAQKQWARFMDCNKLIKTALAQTILKGLQLEKDTAQGNYTELAKQLKTQLFRVKENLPIFNVL